MSSVSPRQVDLSCIGKKTEREPRGKARQCSFRGLYMSSCFRFMPCAPALASLGDALQPISQLGRFLPTFASVSALSSQQEAESKLEHPDLIFWGLFQVNYSHVFSGS